MPRSAERKINKRGERQREPIKQRTERHNKTEIYPINYGATFCLVSKVNGATTAMVVIKKLV